jgi:hypothetical protein
MGGKKELIRYTGFFSFYVVKPHSNAANIPAD